MLCVWDITKDLGVLNTTVWRWIKNGDLKASMTNRRIGWRIEEKDYEEFLKSHPRWQLVHDGEVYNQSEIKAREDALTDIIATVISVKAIVENEVHCNEYMKGFNRAVNTITLAINQEIKKKIPDSRSEQTA